LVIHLRRTVQFRVINLLFPSNVWGAADEGQFIAFAAGEEDVTGEDVVQVKVNLFGLSHKGRLA
jgi:hypothetical protein